MAKFLCLSVWLAAALLMPRHAWSQITAADRAEIVRLAQQRGAGDAAVAPIIQDIDAAAQRGLPQTPLVNKVKEGLAKGHPAARIHVVVKDLAGHLDRARGLLGSSTDAAGARAIVVLGEALFRGVTPAEVSELQRLLQQGTAPAAAERLALGAQTWATLREGGVAPTTGLPLVADAVRAGAREADLARVARDAVAARRGDGAPVRPRVERPSAPERPSVPERPARPERVEPPRPERR